MAAMAHRDFLDSTVLARLSRLTLDARQPMIGSVTGIHKSAHRGSSVEFAEYRKYVPGDDTRRLDWRVFARTDRFYMKEFEADTNLRCVLALDTSASMGFGSGEETKFTYARRAAATLAYMLSNQGDAVGLLRFDEKAVQDIPPRHSPAHLRHVFNALADASPQGKTDVVQVLHDLAEKTPQRALIVVFSDFFTDVEPLLDAFQHMRFRKHDLVIFHLLDKQELEFTFDRPIRFIDIETNFGMITDPAVIHSGYRDALDRYLKTFQKGCREFGVDYHRVTIDTDYEQVLAAFLLQRMRKGQAGGERR